MKSYVWNLVELPEGKYAVGRKSVFKKKVDADGQVERQSLGQSEDIFVGSQTLIGEMICSWNVCDFWSTVNNSFFNEFR